MAGQVSGTAAVRRRLVATTDAWAGTLPAGTEENPYDYRHASVRLHLAHDRLRAVRRIRRRLPWRTGPARPARPGHRRDPPRAAGRGGPGRHRARADRAASAGGRP